LRGKNYAPKIPLPVDFLATAFLAAGFLATAFLAAGFLATAFLTAGFLAATFLAAGFFATAFLAAGLAAAFFAAGFFVAGVFDVAIFILHKNFRTFTTTHSHTQTLCILAKTLAALVLYPRLKKRATNFVKSFVEITTLAR
jgi:hypothetical protein